VTENKIVLRPLIGLLDGQPKAVVEKIVIEEIRLHRALAAEADLLHEKLVSGGPDNLSNEHAYLSKMIAVHAQHTALSTLLDILGYIPSVPADTSH